MQALGVEDHVVFLDQFVDQATLLDFISMCDVYVTPYLNEAQMTSGTLGLQFRARQSGRFHALLACAGTAGRRPRHSGAVWRCRRPSAARSRIADRRRARRQAMRKRAYSSSRSMTWERTAERYIAMFENAGTQHRLKSIAGRRHRQRCSADSHAPPEMQIESFPVDVRRHRAVSACRPFGAGSLPWLLRRRQCPRAAVGLRAQQSAVSSACPKPDGALRGLRPACLESRHATVSQFHELRSPLARGSGSEDSHGRTLWALGECARSDASASRRRWAASLFAEALPHGGELSLAARLGLHAARTGCLLRRGPDNSRAARSASRPCRQIDLDHAAVETQDWVWFEDGLAYDNARLPQALIVTGHCHQDAGYVEAGLRSLRWLMALQTTPDGLFPAGRHREFRRRRASLPRASISSLWKPRQRSRPALRPGAPIGDANGRPKPRGHSHGFSAVTICRSRWSIWKPGAAAMVCIPTAPTRTGAANPSCRICSALPKFADCPPERKSCEARARVAWRRLNQLSINQAEGALSQFRS